MVGAGALGCSLSYMIEKCRIGEKGSFHLTDHDFIEISNLNRQMYFSQKDIKK